jgi:hypothetical protein
MLIFVKIFRSPKVPFTSENIHVSAVYWPLEALAVHTLYGVYLFCLQILKVLFVSKILATLHLSVVNTGESFASDREIGIVESDEVDAVSTFVSSL